MTQPTAAAPASPPALSRPRGGVALALAIVLAAANLRPAVSSLGPVLVDVRADLGLSGTAAAVLTALPVLCFGVGALVAPRLARRVGSETTLAAVLALIAVGTLLRPVAGAAGLFAGTVLAGAAIAVANVLIPALVKREFPSQTGLLMGLYVSVTMGGAAVAAAVTVPLAEALGGGWRLGLGVWTLPAAAALLLWLAVIASRRRRGLPDDRTDQVPASLLGDPVAWQVTAFMGLQSLVFYALLSWLPSVVRSAGMDPVSAGRLTSLLVLVGVPTALLFPSLVTRTARQRGWTLLTTGVMAAGLAGLLLAPQTPAPWAVLVGVGLGGAFPLALTLVVLRTATPLQAAQLSAMSQGVGYVLAAAGPFLFGVLHDLSGAWTWPLALLLALMVPQALTGWRAGRDVVVGAARSAALSDAAE